jgi:excisionase family DNA binding protein
VPNLPSLNPSPYLVGAAAIAAYAGNHEDTVGEAMRAGELVAYQTKPGGTWRAKPADVEAWVEGRAVKRLRSVGGRAK